MAPKFFRLFSFFLFAGKQNPPRKLLRYQKCNNTQKNLDDYNAGGCRVPNCSIGADTNREGTGGGGDDRPTPMAWGWSLDAALDSRIERKEYMLRYS